jgi:alanine racemase
MAVLPVGYWHGFPRLLSNTGEVLLRGQKGKILGRVSMDLLTADVDGIRARVGDIVTLIGKDGKRELRAEDVAAKAGTTHYELLTRLNPLMERIVT